MYRRWQLSGAGLLCGLALLVSGCGETSNAPETPPVRPDGQVHPVYWARTPQHFVVRRSSPVVPGVAPTAPADGNQASFWAYTDRDAGLTVSIVAEDGSLQPFLDFTVPRGALFRRPMGGPFALRDSIQIDVTWDPSQLQVNFEPTGLGFNPLIRAHLAISYQGANPDFNGDGVVDALDDYISQVLLVLQTRRTDLDPWSVIPSINDVVNKTISGDLNHFTGYAVSW